MVDVTRNSWNKYWEVFQTVKKESKKENFKLPENISLGCT